MIWDAANGTVDALSVTEAPARSHNSPLNMIINTRYHTPRSYCLGLLISGLHSNMNIWKSYTLWASHNFIFTLHSLLMQTATIPRQTSEDWKMDLNLSLFMTLTLTWIMKHQSKRSLDYDIVIYLMLFRGICSFLSTKRCLKSCFMSQ